MGKILSGTLKTVVGLAVGAGIIYAFYDVQVLEPARRFREDFETNDDSPLTAEEQYSLAYSSRTNEACTEKEALVNSAMLGLTLSLLYWMLQHWKIDLAMYRHCPATLRANAISAIDRSQPLGLAVWSTLYVGFFAALLYNCFVVFPHSTSAGFGVWVAVLVVWTTVKDMGKFAALSDATRTTYTSFSAKKWNEKKGIFDTLKGSLNKDKTTPAQWRSYVCCAYEMHEASRYAGGKYAHYFFHPDKHWVTRMLTNIKLKLFRIPDPGAKYPATFVGCLMAAAGAYLYTGKDMSASGISLMILGVGIVTGAVVFPVAAAENVAAPTDYSLKLCAPQPSILAKKENWQTIYEATSWEWWNGAWLNFWRLLLVSSIFHMVAMDLASGMHMPKFPNDSTIDENPDECATYTSLEQFNMMSSLVLTLLLFGLLIGLGTLKNQWGKWARKTIGTEDIRVSGQWWNMIKDKEILYALWLYMVVFAAGAHGGGVALVQHRFAAQLRDAAIHQSFRFTKLHKKKKKTESSTGDEWVSEISLRDEQSQSVVRYALINDLVNNFIMIGLLVVLVPAATEDLWPRVGR